ncbi:cell division protein FtsQ/DivIB [Candidatus Ishikawella capsulata]|uniref:cell division protein FtsQ/DivIB n=1 Tax=Candidatus Ishikawella capsulata TaxID=168169 RepID=UPI00130DDF80|nr:cell division protein FtsQ/DivIB [Candidatus Ishikawaella capsulata]
MLKCIEYKPSFLLHKGVVICKMQYVTAKDLYQTILQSFINNFIKQPFHYLPSIKNIIHKQWPDDLKSIGTKSVPVACWNNSSMLDKNGITFYINSKNIINKESLPMLYGPQNNEKEVLINYNHMKELLKICNIFPKIISMSEWHSWYFITNNEIKVILGRNNIDNKLQIFIKLYPTLMKEANMENKYIEYIDLRYNSGAAVHWLSRHNKSVN